MKAQSKNSTQGVGAPGLIAVARVAKLVRQAVSVGTGDPIDSTAFRVA
jgi:hypothetical protein